jgi:hypothetical protein
MSGTGIARLYYEAHITVEPYMEGSKLDNSMKRACEKFHMRVSKFLMFHEGGEQPKAFTSMRDEKFQDIYDRLFLAVNYLEQYGHKVLRYKIEDTLFDSKHGDKFE